ncbi:hypothetical protein TELCIR_21340, partial [Teladorsagia circumcincta]
IQISNEQKADEKYNKALADEFYTAQSKMLAYLSIMGKIREFMEQILANGDRFINGVLSLLEQCPAELIVVRKDVLITLKFFFISDLRPKFIQLLPRLLSEVALIGSGYTAVDHLRSNTADDDKSSDDVIREEVRRCSIDTAPEMEIGPADPLQPPSPALPIPKENGMHKQSSPGSILTQMYAMNAPPIPLVEARTIVKFILLACKMGTSALSGANRSSREEFLCTVTL